MIISEGFLFSRSLLVRDKLFRRKVEKTCQKCSCKGTKALNNVSQSMSLNAGCLQSCDQAGSIC